jgi:hypothetical protein
MQQAAGTAGAGAGIEETAGIPGTMVMNRETPLFSARGPSRGGDNRVRWVLRAEGPWTRPFVESVLALNGKFATVAFMLGSESRAAKSFAPCVDACKQLPGGRWDGRDRGLESLQVQQAHLVRFP